MNRFGIRVYGDGIYIIDNIDSSLNSIKDRNNHYYNKSIIKFRFI